LIVNRDKPPPSDAELRRAMALIIDRKAFIDIIADGQGDIGGNAAGAEGNRGMPTEMLRRLPGYDPTLEKPHAAARAIMEKQVTAGEAPDHHRPATSRLSRSGGDPDRSFEGDLHDGHWTPSIRRNGIRRWHAAISSSAHVTESGVDDPDQQLRELTFAGGAQLHRLL
jgi:hypothetical protein